MARLLTVFAALLLALPASAGTADKSKQMPKPITPGPEHAFIKGGAGTWTVVTKHWQAPGAEPMKASGKMVAHAVLDGMGLHYEFTGDEQHGMRFRGFGFTTWIPAKKHYESYWFDVFSHAGMTRSTGTWDEKTKTLNAKNVGPDGLEFRVATVYPDDDHHTTTLFIKMGDKEMKIMELVYTRSK